ncbi:MAG: DNA repair protein RadC [Treponema sp.]|nr:DNA repair protein RadC [Treponema sp.]
MKNDSKNLKIRELTLLNGLSFPSDEELVMLIIGSGTKERPVGKLSREVLSVVLKSNPENVVQNLMKVSGIGSNKALAVAAALELGRRLNRTPQVTMCEPGDIIPYIKSYSMQSQEHFLCVSLNGAREVISIRVVCVGAGNMAVIHPSEIFAEAIKEHASAIVVSHNHPSGNPTPSNADIKTTHELVQASQLLGIALLDHIILGKNCYFSFLEHDMLV